MHRGTNGSINVSQIEVDDKKAQKKPAGANSLLKLVDEYEVFIAPLVFTAFSFFTRMWKIGLSDIVTWDEAQYVAPHQNTELQQLTLAVLANSAPIT